MFYTSLVWAYLTPELHREKCTVPKCPKKDDLPCVDGHFIVNVREESQVEFHTLRMIRMDLDPDFTEEEFEEKVLPRLREHGVDVFIDHEKVYVLVTIALSEREMRMSSTKQIVEGMSKFGDGIIWNVLQMYRMAPETL